jgi:hypothetical protein
VIAHHAVCARSASRSGSCHDHDYCYAPLPDDISHVSPCVLSRDSHMTAKGKEAVIFFGQLRSEHCLREAPVKFA